MGEVREPQPVKVFVGILTAQAVRSGRTAQLLEEQLGPIDCESQLLDFTYTDFYEPEMGPGLKRKLWGFGRLAAPDSLVDLKLFTNRLEQTLAINGKRTVNIDPGYLTPARVVLASTKDFGHRLYLGKGIYGEVTLMYQKKGFQSAALDLSRLQERGLSPVLPRVAPGLHDAVGFIWQRVFAHLARREGVLNTIALPAQVLACCVSGSGWNTRIMS